MNEKRYSLNTRETRETYVIIVLAGLLCYASFSGEPAEAFLFPRLFSVTFFILSWFMMIEAILLSKQNITEAPEGLSLAALRVLMPGIAIMSLYVFILAEELGFYASSFLVLMLILSFYDGKSVREASTWLKRFALSSGMTIVVYLMFNMLLKVQTPRGFLF